MARDRIRTGVFVAVAGGLTTVYFAPLGDWLADDPLPGQSWMRDNLVVAGAAAVLVAIVVYFLTRSAPAARRVIRRKARRYRNTEPALTDLRVQMRQAWIDRVLARSLERVVPIELNFTTRPGALNGPLLMIGDDTAAEEQELPPGTHIGAVFDDRYTARRLVVLGAPGSGKSTQLLHLAERLLDRADQDPREPVPVILPLSAGKWELDPGTQVDLGAEFGLAATERSEDDDERPPSRKPERDARAALREALDWMAGEIARRYQVPRREAYDWLIAEHSPIVVLLDGLDEIQDVPARQRCARTLALLRTQRSVGMVVSCRTEDYRTMRIRLNFGAAVEIQPLSPEGVDAYLASAGPELEPLRRVCAGDGQLLEIFRNALHLAIAVLTYRGRVPDQGLLEGTARERLDHLWREYLDQMLHRRRDPTRSAMGDPRYSPAKTYRWLGRLAGGMQQAGRTEFRRELIDARWLPRGHGAAVRSLLVAAWMSGTVVVMTLLTLGVEGRYGPTMAAMFLGVTALALAAYLSGRLAFAGIAVGWRFEPMRIVRGLLIGLTAGAVVGVFIGTAAGPAGLLAGLLPGGLLGLIGGVASAAVPQFDRRPENEQRSASGHTVRVQLGVLAGMAAIPIGTYTLAEALVSAEWAHRAVLLAVAPGIGATWGAASANFQPWAFHRVASLWALAFGLLPRRLDRFLAHADERIIMRRMAGGYQFLHLTLQEYLAKQETPRRRPPRPARQPGTVPEPRLG